VRPSQEQYCNGVLKRFQMSDYTPVDTPREANLHLAASDSLPLDKKDADMVRNCQELAAKRILRYLAGTRSLGSTYKRGAMDPILLSVGMETAPNQLSASADADHAGADDHRSISGWAIMLAGAMIAWSSKRQPVTAISSTESKF